MFPTSLIIFLVLQSTAKASNCGQVIPIDGLFPNGSFSSPGWPNPYQSNQNCTWSISSLQRTYIKLTITHFDLQDDLDCNDKVVIRPGNEAGVKLCAHSIDVPFVFYSSNNRFDVHFIADGTTVSQSTGFQAEYIALKARCRVPRNLDGLEGRIFSPNFPNYYPSNMFCEYNITVPVGYHVELNFSAIDIEDEYNCTNDYVMVDDVFDQYNMWVLCGKISSANMPSYRSKGRSMLVTFVSDDNIIASGFEAKFKAIKETPSFGIISSYVAPTNMFFTHSTPSWLSSKQHELVTKSTVGLVAPSKTLTDKPVMTPSPTVTLQETDYLTGAYRSMTYHTIKSHSVKQLSTSSEIICVLLCQQSPKCKSVTYLPIPQSSGLCTLYNTAMDKEPWSIKAAESHTVYYYELIT